MSRREENLSIPLTVQGNFIELLPHGLHVRIRDGSAHLISPNDNVIRGAKNEDVPPPAHRTQVHQKKSDPTSQNHQGLRNESGMDKEVRQDLDMAARLVR
jgi:hypothetical protein